MSVTLLEMLLDSGLITPNQCDEALQNRVFFGGRIGTNLVELGYLQEDDLARFLSKKLVVPYVEPEKLLDIPREVVDLVPRELAIRYQVVPVREEGRRLSLVMADPSALTAIDEISFITGRIVRPMIAPEIRVVQALGRYYDAEIDGRYREILRQVEERRDSEPPAADTEAFPLPELRDDGLLVDEASLEREWVRQVEHYTSDQVLQTLARAENRGEIADALMGYLGQEWNCVALFTVRGETASGWKALAEGSEVEEFDLFHIPLNRPSVLKTVVEGRSYYLGGLADAPLNGRLLKSLGLASASAALVMPLVVGNRVASILYVEGRKRELGERVEELGRLLGKAALAFEILIARDKILMT